MKQEINLYQRAVAPKGFLPFFLVMQIIGAFGIIMIIISGYLVIQNFKLKHVYNQLGIEEKKLENKIQIMTGAIPTEEAKKKTADKIAQLETEQSQKIKILSSLGNIDSDAQEKLSDYLETLSLSVTDNIAIQSVVIKKNGEYLNIKGVSKRGEFVPALLQSLGQYPAFKSKVFNQFKLLGDPDKKDIAFLVETAETQS